MASHLFLKSLAKLDQWRERYNPFKGLTMRRLAELLEEGDRGEFINLQWLLRKMERRNATVRACNQRMQSEVKKLEWTVKIPSELPKGYSEAQAKKQQEFLLERYNAIDNLTEANAFLVGAEFKGFAHCEKHYGADGYPVHLEPVPQWHWWKKGFYGAWHFDQTANGNTQTGDEIKPENFLIHEVENPWYEIALICALREVLGSRDFEAYVKDYGVPWFFIISPPGTDQNKADQFQSVADEVVGDGRGVLPHGSSVQGPPAGSNSQSGIFTEFLAEQRKSIVLAATGGMLTMLTESGSGTLAGGAHQEAWENIVGGAAQSVAEVFQEQFDKPFLQEKFPGQPPLCYFSLAYPEATEERKDVVTDIKTLHDAGYNVTRENVEELTGFELEEKQEPDPAKPAPGAKPAEAPAPPIKNRATTTPDTTRLAENALAEVLDVGTDYLLPIAAPLQRLIALAESETSTLEDFSAFAGDLQRTFPELLDQLDLEALADALEPALGTAAVAGVREGMRERAKAAK